MILTKRKNNNQINVRTNTTHIKTKVTATATTFAQNCYNIINATEGSAHLSLILVSTLFGEVFFPDFVLTFLCGEVFFPDFFFCLARWVWLGFEFCLHLLLLFGCLRYFLDFLAASDIFWILILKIHVQLNTTSMLFKKQHWSCVKCYNALMLTSQEHTSKCTCVSKS